MTVLPSNRRSESAIDICTRRGTFLAAILRTAPRRVANAVGVQTIESKAVKSVIERFCGKYGAADVKKYSSKFDVAVVVEQA
jgi:hypothetical protein